MKRVVNSLVTHLSTLVLLAGAAAVSVGDAFPAGRLYHRRRFGHRRRSTVHVWRG